MPSNAPRPAIRIATAGNAGGGARCGAARLTSNHFMHPFFIDAKDPPMTPKTTAKKTSPSTTAADAIKLLTDDHKEVHALFAKYKKLIGKDEEGAERQPLAEQICMLLTVHASIEEEIFYPAARKAGIDADLLDEADVEHASCNTLIAQIRDMGPSDGHYDAKVAVLGEYIDHHVKEEQDELFPKCRKSSMDLSAVGSKLARRKEELMAEMSEGMEVLP
jgi:Hemerythrin HHE cation binding domain